MNSNPKEVSETLLHILPKRTSAVLEKRFGLGKAGKRHTLEAIGSTYKITRERVRQIERDGIGRIQKSAEFSNAMPLFALYREQITNKGGMLTEDRLLKDHADDTVSRNTTRFLLTLSPELIYRGESDSFYARWGIAIDIMDSVEQALVRVANTVYSMNDTIPFADLAHMLSRELSAAGNGTSQDEILSAYIALSKELDKNCFNGWGHVSSPLVRPRGVRDLAYLVFQKERAPMHFSKAAEHIRTIVSPRRVHAQTVHNELIKDGRFVLVGRGTYGLADWGYEQGTVRDIIVRALREGPQTKDDITRMVLSKRQVKENTILINLQNKSYFKKCADGTYANVVI
jgi:hypothetical protein